MDRFVRSTSHTHTTHFEVEIFAFDKFRWIIIIIIIMIKTKTTTTKEGPIYTIELEPKSGIRLSRTIHSHTSMRQLFANPSN